MFPLVSVIAPMFNGEKYIRDFIISIQQQSYNNWELILVDDGSTDSTISIVKEYAAYDTRIKLIIRKSNEIKGANTCRNIGIKNIKGKYFIIFDSDDKVEPYSLSQRVAFMEENEEVDYGIFPGRSYVIDENGDLEKTQRVWGKDTGEEPLSNLLKGNYSFGVWNLIFKTKTMASIYWDEQLKIFMDFDYLFRILVQNFKYEYSSDAKEDYGYIQGRKNAITSSFVSDEKYESTKYLLSKTMEIIEKNQLSNEYKKYFYHFYLLFYKKVVLSKDYNMYKDYYNFFLKSFGEKYNLRLRALNVYCGRGIKRKTITEKKLSRLIVRLFFR